MHDTATRAALPTPFPPERLAKIEARAAATQDWVTHSHAPEHAILLAHVDVPDLLAEVKRLAVELADAQSRIANARGEIWRQDTAARGTPAQQAVSEALAAVETHLEDPQHRPSRAWLFWGEDGTLLDDAVYDEGPVTRERAAADYAADRDMPPATIEPIPDDKLAAIRALYEQTAGGRRITRDDLKEILP